MKRKIASERCALCGCRLSWGNAKNEYAKPTPEGRSHGTRHHHVPERFFGRSTNRKGTQWERIFDECPWHSEGYIDCFCYECHEELLHNPVLLPEDVELYRKLVKERGLDEDIKTNERTKIAGRIRLFHEVIHTGLKKLTDDHG